MIEMTDKINAFNTVIHDIRNAMKKQGLLETESIPSFGKTSKGSVGAFMKVANRKMKQEDFGGT